MDGKIVLVYGPMKSGKSATLIDIYNSFIKQGVNVECFKPTIDTRDVGFIKSRAYDFTVPCKMLYNMMDCIKSSANIIMIDEFQFIQSQTMFDIVNHFKKSDKTLYVFGLDKIANGDEWPAYSIIKNLVDKKIKLTATCELCGDVAEYTKIENGTGEAIQVEGDGVSVKYFPVCRKCFYKK